MSFMTDVSAIMTLDNLRRIPEFTTGDRLRKARETAGFEQAELALMTGLSRATVSNYERNEVKPRKSGLNLWALATGVPVEWLLTGCTPSDLNREPTDYEFGRTPAIVVDLFGGRAA